MRVLVIGGNAAGMSAASRIKRRSPDTEVIVLEATREVSYGACGLPYFIAGVNQDPELIRIRSVEAFQKAGVKVLLESCAVQIDYTQKRVSYLDGNRRIQQVSYDKLLIASGSSPSIPPIPGIQKEGIFPLKTLSQAQALKQALEQRPRNAVIVGGGYIGLELAEACLLQKVSSLRIIEAQDRLLNGFDAEFSDRARQELERHGVNVHLGEKVLTFAGDSHIDAVLTDKGRYEADLVILSIGIRPNTAFTGDALEKLRNGAIVTDPAMRTNIPDVFAAGDCAAVWHRLLDQPVHIALGTYANRQGRLAGDSILGEDISFKRALGTSMLRCMGVEFAKTGLGEQDCIANHIPYKTNTVQARSHARYYPGASMLTIKLCYRPEDRVLIGAQIMGEKEAACRIDTFACAIDQQMKTNELGFLDLGYAPPFASVWDAIQIAANAAK